MSGSKRIPVLTATSGPDMYNMKRCRAFRVFVGNGPAIPCRILSPWYLPDAATCGRSGKFAGTSEREHLPAVCSCRSGRLIGFPVFSGDFYSPWYFRSFLSSRPKTRAVLFIQIKGKKNYYIFWTIAPEDPDRIPGPDLGMIGEGELAHMKGYTKNL